MSSSQVSKTCFSLHFLTGRISCALSSKLLHDFRCCATARGVCPGKEFKWRLRFSVKQLCVSVKDVMFENGFFSPIWWKRCVLFRAAPTAFAGFLSQLTE